MAIQFLKKFAAFCAFALLVFGSIHTAQAQGFNLYGAPLAFNSSFYQVNQSTGALTTVTDHTNAFYAGMDVDPVTNTLYSVAGSTLYTVDPGTGQPRTQTPITVLSGDAPSIFSLSFSPAGVLYGLDDNGGTLYTIDPLTGIATFIGTSNTTIFGLEFGANGILYGCDFDLYQINPLDGSATDLGSLTPNGAQHALFLDMDFAPDGTMYGVTNNITTDSLYSIDTDKVTATLIGPTGGNLDAIASQVPSLVPEPQTWAWLAIGGACLAISTMRRRALQTRKD